MKVINQGVAITVAANGDVLYMCAECDYNTRLAYENSYENHVSVFWDIYAGVTLLTMIQHVKDNHHGVPYKV